MGYELRKKIEEERGKKLFISVFSKIDSTKTLQIEKFIAVRKFSSGFGLEVFSTNNDLTLIKDKKIKNVYLGDDDYYSYYLLNFIFQIEKIDIKKEGMVFFINGSTYIPLTKAFDLCNNKKNRHLIELISNTNI